MPWERTWRGWAAVLGLLWAGGWCVPAAPATTPEAPSIVAPFTLPDQYGTNHVVQPPLSRVTLITVADQAGADELTAWVHPVHSRYGDRVQIVGVADVSAAPRLLRAMLRRQFRRQYSHPVLLDWEGKAAKDLGGVAGHVVVLVVDRSGAVRWRAAGESTAAKLEQLLVLLDRLAEPEKPSAPASP